MVPFEDLSEYFDLDEFAVEAVFVRDDVTIAEVRGILETSAKTHDISDHRRRVSSAVFHCPARHVDRVRKDDEFTSGKISYTVASAPQLEDGIAAITLAPADRIYA